MYIISDIKMRWIVGLNSSLSRLYGVLAHIHEHELFSHPPPPPRYYKGDLMYSDYGVAWWVHVVDARKFLEFTAAAKLWA